MKYVPCVWVSCCALLVWAIALAVETETTHRLLHSFHTASLYHLCLTLMINACCLSLLNECVACFGVVCRAVGLGNCSRRRDRDNQPNELVTNTPYVHVVLQCHVLVALLIAVTCCYGLCVLAVCRWSGQLHSPSRPRQPTSSPTLLTNINDNLLQCIFNALALLVRIFNGCYEVCACCRAVGLGNCSRCRDRDNQLLQPLRHVTLT